MYFHNHSLGGVKVSCVARWVGHYRSFWEVIISGWPQFLHRHAEVRTRVSVWAGDYVNIVDKHHSRGLVFTCVIAVKIFARECSSFFRSSNLFSGGEGVCSCHYWPSDSRLLRRSTTSDLNFLTAWSARALHGYRILLWLYRSLCMVI